MKIKINIFILILMLFTVSCAVNKTVAKKETNNAQSSSVNPSNTVNPADQTLQLVDYLRRIPGIQISGSKDNPQITIRNAVSLSFSDTSPLFVIDGRPIGNSYTSAAAMIDVNDIKSITVLKDVASTSTYGMQGANGVIVIYMKKGNGK